MSAPRRLGRHPASGKEVYLIELLALGDPMEVPGPPSRHFTCLTVLDAIGISSGILGRFCIDLLHRGCVYFSAFGPDCERVHDIMDEEMIGRNPPESVLEGIMTTWHSDESLADAIDFFLVAAVPDELYESDCDVALIISVGAPTWAIEIESLLPRLAGS